MKRTTWMCQQSDMTKYYYLKNSEQDICGYNMESLKKDIESIKTWFIQIVIP